MSRRVKNLSYYVERVSDDDYAVGVGDSNCLVNAALDSKNLSLSCGYIDGTM